MSAHATWTLKDGRILLLLTEEQLNALPDGTRLVSIAGQEVEKGVDYIDLDTRGGWLAYGHVSIASEDPS